MSRGNELQRLFKLGLITEREYRRGCGMKLDEYANDYGGGVGPSGPGGAYGADGIAEKKAQRADVAGGGKTVDFGPSDAGHIDARANRRASVKGSTPRAPGFVGVGRSRNTSYRATNAQVRASSADEFFPNWYRTYGDPARRQD
jgi:hypothetical protein